MIFPMAQAFEGDGGLWCHISAGEFDGRPALFLDRDGVVIADTGYLGRGEGVRLLPHAAAAIARCNRLAIAVVLTTNQSGIARGYYDWQGFHAVQDVISAGLAAAGAHFDAVLACAHHRHGRPPLDVADHPWRKPNPGMILAAGRGMNLDLPHSWIVGDRASDIAAGLAAELAGGVLISTIGADPQREAAQALRTPRFAVDTCASLAEAVALLLARGCLATGEDQAKR